MSLKSILESKKIETSAPCRIDMGGTLDISTFYYPLRHFFPATFNIALDLRTYVRLHPYKSGFIKVTSKGFESAQFNMEDTPFDHPLGLMFAVATYFNAHGIHIDIESTSPPKSALGGSSSAAIALVGALNDAMVMAGSKVISPKQVVRLAHEIEASVAGVPCGIQDQLAAAFGGINVWQWTGDIVRSAYIRQKPVPKSFYDDFEKHILVAYCGIEHESKDINGRWVKQFLTGKTRSIWIKIIENTKEFIDAIKKLEYKKAAVAMNAEMELRRKLTPDVLDQVGEQLYNAGIAQKCGVRFCGAGGGGCLWAIGDASDIQSLRHTWLDILTQKEDARLLDVKIDRAGLQRHHT